MTMGAQIMAAAHTRSARDEQLDARLERWAKWRRDANTPRGAEYRCMLAALHGEGAELDRAGSNAAHANETIRLVRSSLLERINAARKLRADAIEAGKGESIALLGELIERLRRQRARFPADASKLPWASMIHGSGARPDPDCPEEEETEMAVHALAPVLRGVVHAEYRLAGFTQDEKAKRLGFSRSTFIRRLGEAQSELKYRLLD